MQQYKYVIIGGGIAGTTAAETIRKRDAEGSIAIVSDEPHTLYSRVLLSKPKWVLGEQPFENVWLKKQEWYDEMNIHLFKGIAATSLDAVKKTVTLSDGDVLEYQKLLLATGAHSRKFPVPGADKKGVHYMRTVDDARGIALAAQGEPKRVVMIGSACVSFEIIEILHSRGFKVTEVMREKYFFEPQLSETGAGLVEKVLEEKGIEIVREMEIEEILGDDTVAGVKLKDGRIIDCELVLPFIGVELDLDWVKSAGVAIGKGIFANTFLETNVTDIWTAGDSTQCWDAILGETVIMGNWMSARLQGELAGKNMTANSADEREPFEQVSFHTSHGFGFQIGWTGDVRPLADRIILRYPTEEENTIARVIVKNGRVIGGTTVNRPDLVGKITKMIKSREDYTDRLHELGEVISAPKLGDPTNPTASRCG